MLQNAPSLFRLNGMGGDEYSDFKNPIDRPAKAGLSGNRIFMDKLTILRREFCVKNKKIVEGSGSPIKRIDDFGLKECDLCRGL